MVPSSRQTAEYDNNYLYIYNLYSTNLYLRCRGLKQSIYLPMRSLVMKISLGR